MKKQFLIATSSLLIAGAGGGAVAAASAQTSSAKQQPHAHTRHAGTQRRLEARLNQAERDGTITAAQKSALQAELKNLRTERTSTLSNSSSAADRRTERTKQKTELAAWAAANNFPLAKIFPKLSS